MAVRFHPAARDELRDARRWYEERSPLAALSFAQEVARAVQEISDAPSRYPRAEHGTHRFTLRRFPFSIFYRARENDIVVMAVAHQKRRPRYWARR